MRASTATAATRRSAKGLDKAADVMDAGARSGAKQVQVFLSDGRPNPDNSTNRPSAGDIDDFQATADEVFSIAIGAGGTGASNPDLTLMQSLAKGSGTHYYHVTSASDLPDVFDAIYESIACRPGIHVDKTADPTSLPAGGGDVTYTYVVTNTGDVALSSIKVTDDKCSPVEYVSGDEDGNEQARRQGDLDVRVQADHHRRHREHGRRDRALRRYEGR